nr:hypothetical protein BaRGS_011183 [Batillaria attramentaria]
MDETKSGILSVTDGQNKVHTVRLVLYPDALLIQKEEWVNVPLDDEDEVFLNMTNHREQKVKKLLRPVLLRQTQGMRLEKQWMTAITIPLLYARLSRYLPGTDKLRSNCFEVVGVDGSHSGPILCEDNRTLAEWIQAITSNTQGLLTQMDEELPDDRQHCCSIQTGGRDLITLSLDSRADLLHLEKAWYHTSNTAVKRLVELECTDLQTLIFCIHAFLSAKLSTVDPTFLANY